MNEPKLKDWIMICKIYIKLGVFTKRKLTSCVIYVFSIIKHLLDYGKTHFCYLSSLLSQNKRDDSGLKERRGLDLKHCTERGVI